jgi:gluconate 2-dehydrogenase gamma chain
MNQWIDRRNFLNHVAVFTSALLSFSLGGRSVAREIQGGMPWREGTADAPIPVKPGPFVYFIPSEAAFIDAAVARLFPNDDTGPGAKELGVTVFIDRQLAGPFGRAERWYMEGPFDEQARPTFGYQTHFTPAQLYRAGIKAVDDYTLKTNTLAFAQLTPQEQNNVLELLEKGKVHLDNVDGTAFFNLLLQNTVEGCFSDPIYGGNHNMAAWKMIGFPGARYDYRDWVGKHNQRFPLPPVGLMGRPEWLSQG